MEEGSRAGTVFSDMEITPFFAALQQCIFNIDLKVFLCQYEVGRTQRSKSAAVKLGNRAD
jgi:hypothetical protein